MLKGVISQGCNTYFFTEKIRRIEYTKIRLMIFIVDSINKIIFGWSPKCGCSIVKTIAWYLIEGCSNPEIHTYKDIMDLPEDMEKYTVIMVCRDPFKRIVSGFLDKYNKQGIYRCMWGTDEPITFR